MIALVVGTSSDGAKRVQVSISDPLQASAEAQAELCLPAPASSGSGPVPSSGNSTPPPRPGPASPPRSVLLIDPSGREVREPPLVVLQLGRRLSSLGGLTAADRVRRDHHLGVLDQGVARRSALARDVGTRAPGSLPALGHSSTVCYLLPLSLPLLLLSLPARSALTGGPPLRGTRCPEDSPPKLM